MPHWRTAITHLQEMTHIESAELRLTYKHARVARRSRTVVSSDQDASWGGDNMAADGGVSITESH